jgi:hypothetical protein
MKLVYSLLSILYCVLLILTKELCLPPTFTLVSCSAYSSTLKMEVLCSSETLDDFQRTTRSYIPEDSTCHRLSFTSQGSFNCIAHLASNGRVTVNDGL